MSAVARSLPPTTTVTSGKQTPSSAQAAEIQSSALIDDAATAFVADSGANDIKAALEIDVEAARPQSVAVQDLTPEEYEKKRARRFLVVQEIYETEKGYCNDLNNLVRNFMDPLNSVYLAGVASAAMRTETANAQQIVNNTTFGNNSGNSWLTFDQKQSIVRNAAHLLRVQKLHCKILEDAVRTMWGEATPLADVSQPVCQDPSVSQIAKCFLTMMPKLEAVYVPYCSQHDTAISTLASIKRANPNQFQAFLDECKSKMGSKLEIQDFLIKPVQRICKYPLLLKELVKSTPAGTLEYVELVEALEKIKQLVGIINEKKKQAENDAKRDQLLGRMHPGQANFKLLGSIYGIAMEEDTRSITLHPQSTELLTKIGNLLRGAGVYFVDHGTHDLPFATTPTMINPSMIVEVSYMGAFMFADIMVVLFPKRANSYSLQHVIPVKSIINIQELSGDAIETTTFGKPAFKNAWRLTWEINKNGEGCGMSGDSIFRSIDLGGKSDKEKYGWFAELQKVIDTQKINYMELTQADLDAQADYDKQLGADSNSVGLGKTASAATVKGAVKKSVSMADNQSILSSNSGNDTLNNDAQNQSANNMQAAADVKFNDVYTAESLVMGHGAGSNNAGNRVSMMQAASNAISASSNAGKALFRKVSLSSKDSNKVARNTSVRKTSGSSSVYGTTDSGATKSSASIAVSVTGGAEPAPLSKTAGNKSSIADMSKWFSRQSNSSVNQDGGDDSQHDTGDKSKWGGKVKAKIMTIGKFSSSNSKKLGAGSMSQSGSQASLASVSSNMSTATAGGTKKSGIFSSLARSFSKRKNKSGGNDMGSQDLRNIDDALNKADENYVAKPEPVKAPVVAAAEPEKVTELTPMAPQKPAGNLERRPASRGVRASISVQAKRQSIVDGQIQTSSSDQSKSDDASLKKQESSTSVQLQAQPSVTQMPPINTPKVTETASSISPPASNTPKESGPAPAPPPRVARPALPSSRPKRAAKTSDSTDVEGDVVTIVQRN